MIDIINFDYFGDKLGFSKFYTFKDFKIISGSNDKKNRQAVENKTVDILMSPEKVREKDFMHSRDSGLNQVLCKIAKKNDIAIGFNFNDVLKGDNKKLIMGRMMQNVRLCRKYKVKMVLISGANNEYELRGAYELASFGRIIGMTPKEVKEALNFKKGK